MKTPTPPTDRKKSGAERPQKFAAMHKISTKIAPSSMRWPAARVAAKVQTRLSFS
ncbi:hypothetical protein [Xanthomonas translucens]|uniref:hypothetical protein n=1 Tax=Xanthomonas campestris pv. translucens TaxID=343 RepID=UPI001F241388|nr:hypothetical protein [Xanthomonas translucens]UJB14107.1 hypothetical protein LTC53_13970 [Xanthomonas translucens pv. undulosa]